MTPATRARLLLLAALLLAGSCSSSSRVSGDFEGENDPYTGSIVGRQITMVSRSGNRCTGDLGSLNPYASAPVTSWLTGCAGDLGTVAMTCSDGRRVSAGFVARTCSSGVASGWDQNGRAIDFTYTRE
jgi:hypothetical protein